MFASGQVHDAQLLHTIKAGSCTESSLKGFTTEEFFGHESEADGGLQRADNQMNGKESHVNLLGVLNNSETVPKTIHSISVEIIDE